MSPTRTAIRFRLVFAGLVAATAPAVAQTTTLPTFVGPLRTFDRSEFETIFAFSDRSDWGVEVGYWIPIGPFELGSQIAVIDPPGPENAYPAAAVDARLHVLGPTEEFPLHGSVVGGLGATTRDGGEAVLTGGFSVGQLVSVGPGIVRLLPYVEPKLAFIVGRRPDRAKFVLGLGLDAHLGPRLVGRLNVSLGDARGVAIGVAWRQ